MDTLSVRGLGLGFRTIVVKAGVAMVANIGT